MELKRDEIIKALECCTYGGDATKSQVEVCSPCPYFNEGNCTDILKENALSLIKELTEENERLICERDTRDIAIKDFYSRNKELQKANEDLGKHCLELENELQECVDIKTKALNEFSLRLAKAIGTYTKESYVYVHAWFTLVNKIIEDIIGETK